MNRVVIGIAVLSATALPLVAAAQSEHMAHHPTATSSVQTEMTKGVVKRVERDAGRVTIAHEPLLNLRMPAMTMTFLVKDRAWLAGLTEGATVRFVAESVKGELVVVALEQMK